MAKPNYPSPRFWARYRGLVLVDERQNVSLTELGKRTLGRAFEQFGVEPHNVLALSDFEALAKRAKPFSSALLADHELFRKFPEGSRERELLGMLIGYPAQPIDGNIPTAQVVAFARRQANRAA
jgi:hypothetical protein